MMKNIEHWRGHEYIFGVLLNVYIDIEKTAHESLDILNWTKTCIIFHSPNQEKVLLYMYAILH